MQPLEFVSLNGCISCGGTDAHKICDLPNVRLFLCKSCGLKYLNPCVSATSMAAIYENEASLSAVGDCYQGYYADKPEQTVKTIREFERALQLTEKNLPRQSGIKIFDVGFGSGLFLQAAQTKGWDVHGIDPSESNVQSAGRKLNRTLIHGTFESFNAVESQFDVVSFWDVIEHLIDPHAAIEKAKRMLRPQGVILVGLPNDRSAMAKVALLLYRLSAGQISFPMRSLYFPEHVAYYHREALSGLMRAHGFREMGCFYSSTNLAKYSLPFLKRVLASAMLQLGKWVGLQNRFVGVYARRST